MRGRPAPPSRVGWRPGRGRRAPSASGCGCPPPGACPPVQYRVWCGPLRSRASPGQVAAVTGEAVNLSLSRCLGGGRGSWSFSPAPAPAASLPAHLRLRSPQSADRWPAGTRAHPHAAWQAAWGPELDGGALHSGPHGVAQTPAYPLGWLWDSPVVCVWLPSSGWSTSPVTPSPASPGTGPPGPVPVAGECPDSPRWAARDISAATAGESCWTRGGGPSG